MKRTILFILVCLLLIGCKPQQPYVKIGDQKVMVEIADEPAERRQGLMYREELGKNKGMLFMFQDERKRSFWMKNTLIPLDMIFINSNKRIIDIKNDVSPCETTQCPTYTSKEPASYILEVNAGFSEKNNWEVGDEVKLYIG